MHEYNFIFCILNVNHLFFRFLTKKISKSEGIKVKCFCSTAFLLFSKWIFIDNIDVKSKLKGAYIFLFFLKTQKEWPFGPLISKYCEFFKPTYLSYGNINTNPKPQNPGYIWIKIMYKSYWIRACLYQGKQRLLTWYYLKTPSSIN